MYLLSKTSCTLMNLSNTASCLMENRYCILTVDKKCDSMLLCLQRSTHKTLNHYYISTKSTNFLKNTNFNLVTKYNSKTSFELWIHWHTVWMESCQLSQMNRICFFATNPLENPTVTSKHQNPQNCPLLIPIWTSIHSSAWPHSPPQTAARSLHMF